DERMQTNLEGHRSGDAGHHAPLLTPESAGEDLRNEQAETGDEGPAEQDTEVLQHIEIAVEGHRPGAVGADRAIAKHRKDVGEGAITIAEQRIVGNRSEHDLVDAHAADIIEALLRDAADQGIAEQQESAGNRQADENHGFELVARALTVASKAHQCEDSEA